MNRPSFVALLGIGLGCLFAPAAARANDVDIQMKNKVLKGEGKPWLLVIANSRVENVYVDLEGGPTPLHLTTGPMKPGAQKKFSLDPGDKPVEYQGSMRIHYPKKSEMDDVQMELHFTAEVVQAPKIDVKADETDLAAHRLHVTFSRTAAKATLEFTDEDGQTLPPEEVELHNQPAGAPLTVEWTSKVNNPLKIHLTLYDADGFFMGMDLFPWRVDIPHEEVNFPSGVSEIPSSEAPKLDKSLEAIRDAVKRAGHFAELKLYVAGHTDTVGAEEYNQQLSEARAKSIANYFRAHGIKLPILFEGFGEHALAVQTPANTDEPRNRRAEYIIAITDPNIAHATVSGHWKKL
jgi:outer membrane protein OmpA-like peptidoglycan-associated protein